MFGDSICFGQLVSGHKTWASAFARSLEALNSDDCRFLVQNAGVNGNTTRLALERLNYDVASHQPSYVIIQFGMNDCNYWESDVNLPRVSPTAFKSNIIEIVEKCLASGAKHCFEHKSTPQIEGNLLTRM